MSGSRVRSGTVGVPASKLRPPRVRHNEVTRTVLLQRLETQQSEIIAIQAPAGYGKSTAAIQWASRSERPVAWLCVDQADNDPIVLIGGIAAALQAADPQYQPPETLVGDEPHFSRLVVPTFLASIAALRQPVTLVFDDLHHLGRESGEVLRAVIEALPAGSQTAFVGRDLHAVPLALWRGQGRVCEARTADLVFSPEESREAVHTFRSTGNAEAIHHAADGWPVAVYLLSQAGGRPHLADMEEFIESEVVETMPADLREFVLTTAPLGAVTAELAAELSGDARAGHFLAAAITTVLLQPSDSGWFVYHPLLQECVTALLQRENPQRLCGIRTTAARWQLAAGHPDAAVQLAIASGNPEVTGAVLWQAARPALLHGRASTVQMWLDQLDPAAIDNEPELSLAAAWLSVTTGRYSDAVRRGRRALELMPPDWRQSAEAFAFAGDLCLLQAATWVEVTGASEALAAADLACHALATDDPVSCLAVLLRGVNRALVGHPGAEADMLQAAALAQSFGIPSTEVEALAMLGLLRMAHEQLTAGREAVERGVEVYAFHDLAQMATTSAVLSLSQTALAVGTGRLTDLRDAVAHQQGVRIDMQWVLPWYGPLSSAVLADASVRLEDTAAYREHVAAVERSGLAAQGLCGQWLDLARRHHAAASPLSTLTPAEVRVWELLRSRMTLTEIAGSLFLSRETVKSHTSSIYRKLGVATRREAQELADRW